jgi:hypothetical protein
MQRGMLFSVTAKAMCILIFYVSMNPGDTIVCAGRDFMSAYIPKFEK